MSINDNPAFLVAIVAFVIFFIGLLFGRDGKLTQLDKLKDGMTFIQAVSSIGLGVTGVVFGITFSFAGAFVTILFIGFGVLMGLVGIRGLMQNRRSEAE